MSHEPILTYLLVTETDIMGRIVGRDVERYDERAYEKAFTPAERAKLSEGEALVRESRYRPGSGFIYQDMRVTTMKAPLFIAEMGEALDRADRLIEWMSKYVGQMAPGSYGECYKDLNDHGLYMQRRKEAL